MNEDQRRKLVGYRFAKVNETMCEVGVLLKGNGKFRQIVRSNLMALVFVCISTLCFSQKKPKPVSFYKDIDKFVSLHADSVNAIFKRDTIVPAFVFDNNFDLNMAYWRGPHVPNSLRYLVLQKVNEIAVLDYLSYSKDPRMKLLPETDSPLPFRSYSFYDLIKYRLNELREKANYRKFKNG